MTYYPQRDHFNCTVCGNRFGMRSDSPFCNAVCQTRAAEVLEQRFSGGVVNRGNFKRNWGRNQRPF